ncbi:MAG: hypothetical protein HGB17_01400 [Syntrophobacteraceae bacterium]|nr:hypothetical protein [Syntrophobacteraceae bacterium]
MSNREHDIVEIIRDPGLWVYEAWELTSEGHYYLYRYDAGEGVFYRATVPAGAASIQFFPLKSSDHVTLSGWRPLERKELPPFRPRLVSARNAASA